MIRRLRIGMIRRYQRFENFTIDVIYDREQGRAAKIYGAFLWTLSLLFGGIARLRLWLYKRRIIQNRHLGCLVIVVGNLTVGGTGKTPVVEKLARSLRDRGRRVAILSRGYKSKKEPLLKKWRRQITHQEPPPPKVVSDGESVLLDSDLAGDEPYMLARNLPGVAVVVDKDRVKAGLYAIRKFGADTLILDDGFQYFALNDHLQLLMVDKTNPFGNGSLLPRGVLREPIRHLKRASYIFLTKSDGRPDDALRSEIRRHKPDAEFIECAHAPRHLQDVVTNRLGMLSELRGRKVAAFSGIAAPESFESFIAKHGAQIVCKRRFVDHHRYRSWELETLFEEAKAAGAEFAVTTEKDAVRLEQNYRPPMPLYFLRVEIEILSGADDFEAAVSRICFPKSRMRATRRPFAVERKEP